MAVLSIKDNTVYYIGMCDMDANSKRNNALYSLGLFDVGVRSTRDDNYTL